MNNQYLLDIFYAIIVNHLIYDCQDKNRIMYDTTYILYIRGIENGLAKYSN